VRRQAVVYIALEGHAGIDNRVIAARDELGIVSPVPFALVKISDNFREAATARRVAATVAALGQRSPMSATPLWW
jgi:hypothetical protein